MFQLYVCMCISVCVCMCICMCICMCVYICVCMRVCMCVCVCVFIGLPHHSERTCWRYISSSNKLKLKCTLSKLRVNDPYRTATLRLVIDSLAVCIKKYEIIVNAYC